MVPLHSIILFDASVVVIMLIIAYLSRRIGEALKIKPFYRLLYLTAVVERTNVPLPQTRSLISPADALALPTRPRPARKELKSGTPGLRGESRG